MKKYDTIVLASHNEHKVQEFREIVKDKKVLSLRDIGFFQEIEENGKTFEENARIKAKAVKKFLNEKGVICSVMADDSGLCVEALDGRPGIFSARYAGTGNDKDNIKKLLKEMKGKENRRAYFQCSIVFIEPDDEEIFVTGRTYGNILDKEDGESGFGYDPIFLSDELGKSFGKAGSEEKNRVSHRGKAIEKLVEKIKGKEK